MRASSTLFVFVLAAVSASPALAAPLDTGFCTRYPTACSHIGRDVSDDSEALSLKTIFNVGKGIFDVGKSLFGGSSSNQQQQQQRDDSGALNLAPGLPVAYLSPDGTWRKFGSNEATTAPAGFSQTPQKREFVEFMARAAAEADESGSLGIGTIFDIGKGIFDVGKEIFSGNSNNQNRRDFEEFMARATAAADDSGALGLSTIFDIGKGIFDVGKTLLGGSSSSNQQQQRRDFEELMARAAAEADETGALGLGTIFDIGKGIFDVGKTLLGGSSSSNQQQRRDFEELMARAAAEADETGSLGLGTIVDIGKGIFDVGKAIFGGSNNQQQSREFVELLARAAADSDDETGALGLGTIFDIGKGIFDVGKTIFGGSSNNQQSREFIDILSRSDEGAELLRRIVLANGVHGGLSFNHGTIGVQPSSFHSLNDLD